MFSPVGLLKLVVDGQKLIAILWDNEKLNRVKLDEMTECVDDPLLLKIEKQLNEYFTGKRSNFDVSIKASGTEFQEKVWDLLYKIPYGTTCSYKDIAVKLGKPNAVRAIGAAIGKNPISIIIPCHRVVGSNGSLTGFAGGLEKKRMLLEIEAN